VIEDLIVVRDGLTRATLIRMANGVTSRPLTRLNPLELTSKQDDHTFEESRENSEQPASNHASEQPAGNLVSES